MRGRSSTAAQQPSPPCPPRLPLCRILRNNSLSGPLPPLGPALPTLAELDLSHNELTGTLDGATPALEAPLERLNWDQRPPEQALFRLLLGGNRLSGTLPQSWARAAGFSRLYGL